MKKLHFTIILFLLAASHSSLAQAVSASKGAALTRQISQEQMFIHYNTTLLFPGEYLYYKVYLMNSDTRKRSEVSKIGYVELIGQDGKSVFKHKLRITNGMGQGDFFLPTTVPSGTYKLLGYTNWMRNSGNFFAGDLVVINPYHGDQTALTPDESKNKSQTPSQSSFSTKEATPSGAENAIHLSTSKKSFGTRSQVEVMLKGTIPGSYAISVRKKDSLSIPEKPSPVTYSEKFLYNSPQKDSVYLPELRGNLISGKLIADPSKPPTSEGKKVAFSLPGKNYIFKIATTDSNGKFYINLAEEYSTPEAVIQVMGESRKDLSIVLDPEPQVDPSQLTFREFYISPEMEDWILNRSVHNQIENAYYSVKPDTLKPQQPVKPFYKKVPEFYDLDAYTRFATIKETFVEIIRFSFLSKDRQGNRILVVRQPEGATNYNLPTLLLVDGMIVQEHEKFIDYPARKVQSIGILRDNFFLGSQIFAGIIDVTTIEGDFWKEIPMENVQRIDLKVPEPQKLYFRQTYLAKSDTLERIPDLRSQLLWKPDLNFEGKETVLTFYTSDITGNFEIELQGFTQDGNPVAIKKTIAVEDDNYK